jgi:hypothetical protein
MRWCGLAGKREAPGGHGRRAEVSGDSEIRQRIAAAADVLSIARSRHTLEDVYLELVGDEEGGTR